MVSILTCPSNSYFNPRSREGSDNSVKPFVIRIDSISIHAPASGATLEVVEVVRRRVFQSTLPRVERLQAELQRAGYSAFQSTLPRVERQEMVKSEGIGAYFNPRSREWSDKGTQHIHKSFKISIHAPASGATSESLYESDPIKISIHAPASGATVKRVIDSQSMLISIHAPASGATAFIDIFSFTVRLYFISSH